MYSTQSLLYFVICMLLTQLEALLYTPTSSITMVSSVSVPVPEYLPDRRLLVDWCFTMGYDLPSRLSSFYNIPIWPGFRDPKAKRALYETKSHLDWHKKYNHKSDHNRHPSDFSAGELYQGIEDFLVRHGYDETCLLRSVCELAHHPFDNEHRNIVTDIITFFLTPSMHAGFDASEKLYRQTYTEAENRGFLGHNCAQLYPNCRKDLLSVVTKVLFAIQ